LSIRAILMDLDYVSNVADHVPNVVDVVLKQADYVPK